jgi:hypothetical protein
MPIYEMIILCRIGETQAISNLMKQLTFSAYQEGGVIRRFINLGDRISARAYKSKEGESHSCLRYFSVEFDGNPDTKIVLEKVARNHSEALQVFVHKLNDRKYYKQIFNYEPWKAVEVDKNLTEYQNEMLKLQAKTIVDMGGKSNINPKDIKNDIEKDLNKMI